MKSLQSTTHLRTFVPAKDFAVSRAFYQDLGAKELWTSDDLVLLKLGGSQFYLQNAYVKAWAENTMLFLNVSDLDLCWQELQARDLVNQYPGLR